MRWNDPSVVASASIALLREPSDDGPNAYGFHSTQPPGSPSGMRIRRGTGAVATPGSTSGFGGCTAGAGGSPSQRKRESSFCRSCSKRISLGPSQRIVPRCAGLRLLDLLAVVKIALVHALAALERVELEPLLRRHRSGAEALDRLLELERELVGLLLALQQHARSWVLGGCDAGQGSEKHDDERSHADDDATSQVRPRTGEPGSRALRYDRAPTPAREEP